MSREDWLQEAKERTQPGKMSYWFDRGDDPYGCHNLVCASLLFSDSARKNAIVYFKYDVDTVDFAYDTVFSRQFEDAFLDKYVDDCYEFGFPVNTSCPRNLACQAFILLRSVHEKPMVKHNYLWFRDRGFNGQVSLWASQVFQVGGVRGITEHGINFTHRWRLKDHIEGRTFLKEAPLNEDYPHKYHQSNPARSSCEEEHASPDLLRFYTNYPNLYKLPKEFLKAFCEEQEIKFD